MAAALALRRPTGSSPATATPSPWSPAGVDPVEALTLLRGDWHTGYDPREHRMAPLCTPLATQLPHAVGLAHAARLKGDDVVALAMVGDGGTSEGDFHEALNFAAVWQAPVVFLVQNNGFAISVPLAKQTAAPSPGPQGASGTACRAGWSTATTRRPCTRCSARRSATRARAAARRWSRRVTYRMDAAHQRRRRHPLPRRRRGRAPGASTTRSTCWRRELTERGLLDEDGIAAARDAAEAMAADLRERMHAETRRSTRWTCSPTSTPSRPRNCASSAPCCGPSWRPTQLATDRRAHR